jgi:hypothetical protein
MRLWTNQEELDPSIQELRWHQQGDKDRSIP